MRHAAGRSWCRRGPIRRPRRNRCPILNAQAAADYFGAGAEAARAIGEAYLRQLQVEPTRASILEHTGGARADPRNRANPKGGPYRARQRSAPRFSGRPGPSARRDGCCLRTEVELCALTLLPAVHLGRFQNVGGSRIIQRHAPTAIEGCASFEISTLAWLTRFGRSCCSRRPAVLQPNLDLLSSLAIQSVSPSAGPASGGTELTIRGAGFAAGATIPIGGRPATEVSGARQRHLTAKTPASTIAGPVDVVVTLSGRTATLTGGFRYEPAAPNTAPVIRSITAQGRRLEQPPMFADYGETIQITLVVEDAESPAAQLAYQWQALRRNIQRNRPAGRLDRAGRRHVAVNVHHPGDGYGWAACA